MEPTCPNCLMRITLCQCPFKAVRSDSCGMAMNPGEVRRSSSGEAHDAIERLTAERVEVQRCLAVTQKELYAAHEEIERLRRDLRTAQDFAIQITQRVQHTR